MKILVSFFSLFALALPTLAYSKLTQQQVKTYLNGKTVVLCEVVGKGVTTQIQFDGPRSEWVVWLLGKVNGPFKILNATATALEGMNFTTQFNLDLDRGAKIFLTLDLQAVGSGSITINNSLHELDNCRPKF